MGQLSLFWFCFEYRLPDSLLLSTHREFPFLNAHNEEHEMSEKTEGFLILISE